MTNSHIKPDADDLKARLRETTDNHDAVTCAACFIGSPLHRQGLVFDNLPLAQEASE